MKLALVFLYISGFLLSCSLQQQVLFRSSGWIPNIFPRTMMPYYYFANQDYGDQLYEFPTTSDVQMRRVIPSKASSGMINNNPHNRRFGYMLYNLLRSALPPVSTVTFTSTSISFQTTVSTITSASIQNCISSTNFFFFGAITPCSGRKRSIESNPVDPSRVLPIETSQIGSNYFEQDDSHQPYVSSSLVELQENNVDEAAPRDVLAGRLLYPSYIPNLSTSTSVVTSYFTITSYSVIESVIKKSYGFAPGAVLTCLPPGFVVC